MRIIDQSRIGAFSDHSESTHVLFDNHHEGKLDLVVAFPDVWKVEVKNYAVPFATLIPKIVFSFTWI